MTRYYYRGNLLRKCSADYYSYAVISQNSRGQYFALSLCATYEESIQSLNYFLVHYRRPNCIIYVAKIERVSA